MIPELGHLCLWLALGAALLQSVGVSIGFWRNDEGLIRLAVPAAIIQGVLVSLAFAALTWAFVVSDFSVSLVFSNSHSMKPLIYRYTGVWSNHEGSLLLWILVMAVSGLAVALVRSPLGDRFRSRVLSVQGFIVLGFFAFLLFTSNPFERLIPAPTEGSGMNPLLQDLGLAVHPPLLYIGYVGFSVAFAFAVAGMLENCIGPLWARAIRPWVISAWLFLTLGITMGSYWAYYELGWGGWWFWDPVENASLMPWLAGTALFHSVLVVMQRDALRAWTLFLAVAAFSLSIIGTFIVRSGVITSVHAFAVDPTRGVFLLALMALYIGGAFAIYALAAGRIAEGRQFTLFSRESVLVANNLLISSILGIVFVGTLYPMLLEAVTGSQISVGPPYFNQTTVPLTLFMAVLMGVGPFLGWGRSKMNRLSAHLWPAVLAALAFGVAAIWPFGARGVIVPLSFMAAGWLIVSSLLMLRRKGVTMAIVGMVIAHVGVAVTILGATASSAFEQEALVAMRVGDRIEIGKWQAELLDVRPVAGPNWTALEASIAVSREGKPIDILHPQTRRFIAPSDETTESSRAGWHTGELYSVIGRPDGQGRWQIHIWVKPLVRLIWWGGLLMAFGGLFALGGRLRAFSPRQWRQQLAKMRESNAMRTAAGQMP